MCICVRVRVHARMRVCPYHRYILRQGNITHKEMLDISRMLSGDLDEAANRAQQVGR